MEIYALLPQNKSEPALPYWDPNDETELAYHLNPAPKLS
jgi:hypothetical protein